MAARRELFRAVARILIYAMNYAPEVAGVGRCTGEIGDYLTARGHEVTVVTTPPHYPGWSLQGDYKPYRWSSERRGSQTILRCPLHLRKRMSGVWRLLAPLSFAINSAPVVIWQILTQRPEVVLCVEPTLIAAPAALLAAKGIGARTILHVQDLEVDAAFAVGHLRSHAALKWIAFAFERACLTRFGRIVTISRRMAEQLAGKVTVLTSTEIVRNWVDLEQIGPLTGESCYRAELNLKPTDRVALYSGNIGVKQGFDTVLAAAEALRERNDIQFLIAGEGPEKARLQACAAHLPNVRFLPFQPYARMAEFLGLADAHLLPQSADASDLVLPSKLGGMLASGRPIVVTTETGTELASFLAGSAICVEPGRPADLAAAIVAATDPDADDPARRSTRLALARSLSRRDGLIAIEAALLAGNEEAEPENGAEVHSAVSPRAQVP